MKNNKFLNLCAVTAFTAIASLSSSAVNAQAFSLISNILAPAITSAVRSQNTPQAPQPSNMQPVQHVERGVVVSGNQGGYPNAPQNDGGVVQQTATTTRGANGELITETVTRKANGDVTVSKTISPANKNSRAQTRGAADYANMAPMNIQAPANQQGRMVPAQYNNTVPQGPNIQGHLMSAGSDLSKAGGQALDEVKNGAAVAGSALIEGFSSLKDKINANRAETPQRDNTYSPN